MFLLKREGKSVSGKAARNKPRNEDKTAPAKASVSQRTGAAQSSPDSPFHALKAWLIELVALGHSKECLMISLLGYQSWNLIPLFSFCFGTLTDAIRRIPEPREIVAKICRYGGTCTPEADAHKAGVEVRMRVFVPGF